MKSPLEKIKKNDLSRITMLLPEAEITLKSDLREAKDNTAFWIGEGDGYADGNMVYDTWYCSNCDYRVDEDNEPTWNYCPNCGAKMERSEER